MEAAAGVANGRVASLPISSSFSSSQSVRKEWRAISEHSVRNASNEDLERLKLGQSDERTIYEVQQGTGSIDVDYCSITVDGSLDDDLLQQRLRDISTQREKMQQMEIELRAQLIGRSEIMEMQNSFNEQISEHANAAAELKDQLQERQLAIHELELRMEEKDRELRSIKIDNEAAWAKEDLLREQNKELLAFRRERDNFEAERAQQLQQMHELKEHIQEKERQFLDLEEQHRILQETVLYKEEQLREAQAWVARMDAMQATNNHSLQTELRERTEQFHNFWIGCQRQFAEMEKHYCHAIQQLQVELSEARQKNGIYTDESSMDRAISEEASSFGQTKEAQYNINEDGTLSANSGVLPNGNAEEFPPFSSIGNASIKTEHVPGVPIPSSLLGVGAYIPSGQVPALHPFFVPQQGVPHSLPPTNSQVPESHLGHFMPMPAISSHQDWQNQQTVSDGSQSSNPQYQPSQTEQNLSSSGPHYYYEHSADGHILHSDYLLANIVPNQEAGSVKTVSNEEAQVLESNGKQSLVTQQPQQRQQENSLQLHVESRLVSSDQKTEAKGRDDATVISHSKEVQGIITEKQQSAASTPLANTPAHLLTPVVAAESNGTGVVLPEASISTGRTSNLLTPGKLLEPKLLDERSLLACIVRAIPAGSGGRIRISSTLPNRLGKMLAPLHWHDYKKKYGKLDDFVAGHPELFLIEGDFIQLREGAQEIISATAAIAKVAAAAAASIPYSSSLPSVAVTPMAQPHRLKKVPSIDSKHVKIGPTDPALASSDAGDKFSPHSTTQNQQPNGVFNIVQGLTNVKILSKPRHSQELNGLQSEVRSGQSSVHVTVGNGTNPDGNRLTTHQMKGPNSGKHGMNTGGKQQGRDTGAALTPRR